VVLAALTLVRQIAWFAGFQSELGMVGLNTAGSLAFAALSMALSRTRLCGLLPGLAVLSSSALGLGFLIIGFWVPIASSLMMIDPCAPFGLPLVHLAGSAMAFVGLAIMTGAVVDCKQEAGKKMDKPLRIGSLLLALYVQALVLIGSATMTWFSSDAEGIGAILKSFFKILLLFLSAAGIILSLSTGRRKTNVLMSSAVAAAFVAGAILFAAGLSASYFRAISGDALLRIALGVALLFPTFLRRFSAERQ
jgi:hypothetical protein